ncbi:hypothetical protein PHJA_002768500 [Phtheirospermum japonicum]|uniref:Uncharacterized protein n=1 Tax=Phtheirospermum japonicum TaxID=374723 RepID=A0A830DCE3_9LAMI|nr:hypothetical protein PHJA_002768500 [Phtheirospermum japonicum]
MAAWTAAARQAANLARLSTPRSSQASTLVQRRGLSGGGVHHGPPKVNVWQDPLSPSKWKEEHFVIVSLTGWGLLIFGGYKLFAGGKKEEVQFDASKLEKGLTDLVVAGIIFYFTIWGIAAEDSSCIL